MNAENQDQEEHDSPNSKDRRIIGAPVKPTPMVRVRTSVDSAPSAVIKSSVALDEELLAISRRKILKDFVSGAESRKRTIELLGVKKSRFYELLRDFRRSSDYRGLIRQKRGPSVGSTHTTPEMLQIFEAAYSKKYKGLRAGVAIVLDYARRLCLKKGLNQPSRHAVSKFLATKPEREKYYLKYGKAKGDQKYDQRDDFVDFESPLQSIVMDHTQVDLLLVDTVHRDLIVGRPWLTMIICAMTRVILGYYLSLSRPNVITVQLALVSAILRKDSPYNPMKTDPDIYPFCGLPDSIYTDNAAEFISPELIAKCARHGMDWDHRPIGKKWYGGIIERVIGTFMTRGVHFLPGATGSNVLERESFESELNACLDIHECRAWFGDKVTEYHGKKHSSLECSPRATWTHARAIGRDDIISTVEETLEKSFALDFMPSSYDHKIHPYGINFAGRRYSGPIINAFIGEKCELRYNPYDLSSIWVVLGDNFHEISCTRMRIGLSNDWEAYNKSVWISRASADYKNMPDGAICDEYALEAMDSQDAIVENAIEKTTKYKDGKTAKTTDGRHNSPWPLPDPAVNLLDESKVLTSEEDLFLDDLDDYKPTILIDTLDD
jgi:putative transposase